MLNPFKPLQLVKAEVYSSMPGRFRSKRRTGWSHPEMDAENGLLVCQLGVGVWRFDANMRPTHLVHSENERHHHLANIAFGGADRKTVYITDSLSGDVLKAQLPVAGKLLYGHH